VAYTFGTIDGMGDGVFRKVRRELGVTAFGVNVLVLPAGVAARPHFHEEQDELYFVHSGHARFDFPGESHELGPGGLCHVESTTPRQVTSVGDEDLSCSSSEERGATSSATARRPTRPSSARSERPRG